MDEHYTQISNQFDYLYEPFHKGNASIIINRLKLKQNDLLLDIGGATGGQAQVLRKQARLKNPVTILEPCKALADIASTVNGVISKQETVEQFYGHYEAEVMKGESKMIPFNKILSVMSIHHFSDKLKSLDQIITCLPPNGVLLVLKPPCSGLDLPFSKFHLQYNRQLPEMFDYIIPYLKNRDDAFTEVSNEVSTFQIAKSRWYSMIRGRFWSFLHRFSDDEIEESIQELEDERFSGVKEDENITVIDKYIALTVTKK
ncbi:uncharacterized protein LOC116306166 [Actinia tenebrosa]|uniref:Uncharacterized protein LOC116306166 n=1 Tax=Actinia tenebrosa TaxID=6105 RepID=A0A6P8IXF4_ACTTE|nr:uncharacterized protein LOC116306166 [Actinia tenebrosa]